MPEVPRAIFVDDDLSTLNALRRVLRRHCPDWDIKYCQSPTVALELLADISPWVVVSEKQIPEMKGADFLHQVSIQAPQALRVLLTGDVTTNVAFDSVDVAHMLVIKPFKPEALLRLLHRAKCLHTFPVSLAMRKQLGAIEGIPVLPCVYARLNDYLKSDLVDLQQVAVIISHDPVIMGKIIQLANSSFFGFSQNISNPKEAIVRLGINLVKDLVLFFGISKIEDFSRLNELLAAAMDTAIICRQLGVFFGCQRKELDDSFLLGLLHNLGSIVSNVSKFHIIIDKEVDPHNKEAIAGAYLLALWEFDKALVSAVLFQDSPQDADVVSPLCCRLYVAKIVYHAQKKQMSALDEASGLDFALLDSQGMLDDVLLWINQLESENI